VTLLVFKRLGSKQLWSLTCIFSVTVAPSVGWRSSQTAPAGGSSKRLIVTAGGEFSRQETSQVAHGIHQLPAAAAGTIFLPPQIPSTG